MVQKRTLTLSVWSSVMVTDKIFLLRFVYTYLNASDDNEFWDD